MTSDPRDVSSDLERAREISRRLGPEGSPSTAAPEGGFIRFRRRAPSTPAPAAPAAGPAASAAPLAQAEATPVGMAPPVLAAYGARRWDLLTSWLRQAADGRAAFLMDAHGLVMSVDGPVEISEVENVGARLVVAMTHVARMFAEVPRSLQLDVSVGQFHVRGFDLREKDGTVLTAGILGTRTTQARCEHLRQLAEAALEASPDETAGAGKD